MDGRNHRALAPIASHGSAELLSDNTYFMEAEEGDEVSDAFTTTTTTTKQQQQQPEKIFVQFLFLRKLKT
jgi:hypothetical protein